MAANPLETVGHGATLGFSTASSFTSLGTLYDLKPNTISVTQVEKTKLDSAAAESQPGTPDYGEVVAMLPYNFTTSTLVGGWITAKTVQNFRVTVDDFSSTDSQDVFSGWVKSYAPLGDDLKKDETAKASLTIKITGAGTLTTGT